MTEPTFKNGRYVISGHDSTEFELEDYTWLHIIKEKNRAYIEVHFDKIIKTLQKPQFILQSPSEEDVRVYVRHFKDFHIGNSIIGWVYVYILVNINTNRVRTIYTNPKLKNWKKIWPTK